MRDKFINTGLIPVSEILLDQKNYRLGPLENQMECMDMMFEIFGTKIVKLAGHLVQNGISPKPVVVLKNEESRWVVKDGNRRITALKILNNPALAPTEQYKRIFQALKDNASPDSIPDKIECLTTDEATIVKYRELEHMGEQEGIGQITWGATEKQYLIADTGGKLSYPHAMFARQYLQDKGVKEARNVPITNMQRLLEDTDSQQRLGLFWNGQRFEFRASEDDIFDVLKTICIDFCTKSKGVKDIYLKENRQNYLNELFGSRGCKEPTILKGSSGQSIGSSSPRSIAQSSGFPARRLLPQDRPRVIQRGLGLPVPASEVKLCTILAELSSRIDVRKATISASVLTRLVVEFSVDHYAEKNKVPFKNDKLYEKISAVAQSMNKAGVINKKELHLLEKMKDYKEFISANTLNSWIHQSLVPTSQEVCIFWDNIRFFLVKCWK
ncbi:MAG: hypothetical protein EG826_04320 [Deltaproteobacteria bacterium]|nr:hypothetical protein [Deltaproteobacteria bacterium]